MKNLYVKKREIFKSKPMNIVYLDKFMYGTTCLSPKFLFNAFIKKEKLSVL